MMILGIFILLLLPVLGCAAEPEQEPLTVLDMSVNGTPFHQVETAPGQWEWQVDEQAVQQLIKEQRHRDELYRALRTRVLTDEEMREVLEIGDFLNTQNGVPFDRIQKAKELNEAYLTQHRLRVQQDCAVGKNVRVR